MEVKEAENSYYFYRSTTRLDMKAYDFLIKEYDLPDCIIIAYRGLASYEMPKRKCIYFIVTIMRGFDIIDYSMPLRRNFTYNMAINVSLISNLDVDQKDIYEMYKSQEEIEPVFDTMRNDLENDKAYLHISYGVKGCYFFITLVSLYIYYSIYRILREKKISQKISVTETLLQLSKAYVIVQGARRTMATIPDQNKKLAKKSELNLSAKILRN